MSRFADKYRINSIRLPNWNYSSPGNYFVTICTINHANLFGKIINENIVYSPQGQIALNCLVDIPKHFVDVCLDASIVMPNHVHILFHVETHDRASLQDNRQITLIKYDHKNHPDYYLRINQKSNQLIPNVVKQYKSSVKRICHQNNLLFGWQTRYFDEIIHDPVRLKTIKYYIKNNPKHWQKDKLFKK